LPGFAAAALRSRSATSGPEPRRAARFFLGGALAILFVAAAAAPLLFDVAVRGAPSRAVRTPGALERALGLLLGLALLFDLFLLMASLIFQHFALTISPLAAHLDVHRARAPLGARELSSDCDLRRRVFFASRIALRLIVAWLRRRCVNSSCLASSLIMSSAPSTLIGLIELLQQTIDRNLQHLGELRDGYICHTCS